MTEKDELIRQLSSKSDRYGNKIIDFLNKNNLYGLIEATEEQLKEFINRSKNED